MSDETTEQLPWASFNDETALAMGRLVHQAGRVEFAMACCAQATLANLAVETRGPLLSNMSFSSLGKFLREALKGSAFTILDASLSDDYKAWWTRAEKGMADRNRLVHAAFLSSPGTLVALSLKQSEENRVRAVKTSTSLEPGREVGAEDIWEVFRELASLMNPGIEIADRIKVVTSSDQYRNRVPAAVPSYATMGVY